MSEFASNNKYLDCPPRMSDGRHFTDYRPGCHLNNQIKVNNKLLNSFEYRMYLTRNAKNIIHSNRVNNCSKNCCGPCQKPYNVGTMLPESSKVTCNKNNCNVSNTDANGIGQGRNYNSNNECNTIDWEINQKKNCCSTSEDLFNYYGNGSKNGGNKLTGGDPRAYKL